VLLVCGMALKMIRITLVAAFVVACAVGLRVAWEDHANRATPVAQAQTNIKFKCGRFPYQENAQAFFDANRGIASELDGNGDGVACEHLPSRSGDGGASPTVSPTPTISPTVPATTSPSEPASPTPKTVMDSGGPKNGPVPRMPGGACPDEYPVERGGGCYR
jgi:hypothetical protein